MVDIQEIQFLKIYNWKLIITKWAIVQITGILSHLKNNPTYMPYGFTNYGDTLIERPGWDMPRMTNTARFRPPGYPNWR